ncbi:MAG: family 20 glycosylhydrolase [Chitinophagaceae bacterium]|nr:family 20 glycosylhydrolase [Chitinophagaceae bacterium]
MKKILLLPVLFISLLSSSQTINEINIMPQPVDIKFTGGYLTIKEPVGFIIEGSSGKNPTLLFKKFLNKTFGFTKFISGNTHSYGLPTEIFIEYEKKYSTAEGYKIEITKKGIKITGTENGVFYAFQTLQQLFPLAKRKEIKIPYCTITDYPRFPYRGMHLDVGRHFFPPSFIKKYIDYLAYHKLNTFHWHLTEDQGWRIEIKKYPRLTSVGGYRNGTITGRFPGNGNNGTRYGGYYTQQEIKDIVKYAADRYITVIPEIEMPGHSSAAIAAYPQLSCFPDEPTIPAAGTAWAGPRTGKQVQQGWGVFEDVFSPSEYTFTFLENVLDEVMQLFPSKYIHIGGDECPKENWKRSAFCQQLIKEKGLKDEHGLQSYFIQRIEKYLNSKGRNIIGWNEILEGGLAPNATVMSWQGEEGGSAVAKAHHDVIMCPQEYCYFDHSQSKNEDSVTIGGYVPLETVYSYEPIPKGLNADEAKYVLGAQGNVWTEYMTNPGKVEYMIFPRMSALSEVLWSPKEKRNWKDFERRFPALIKRYEFWGANYSTTYYNLQASILPTPDYNGVLWKLESKNIDGNIIYVKGKTTNATFNYSQPVLINKNAEYGAVLTRKDHTLISKWLWQQFSFNKATAKKITLKEQPSSSYPGSGAFTLVNGVITERGLSQSAEWLGFLGKDLEAVIDFGKEENINKIRLNVLLQEGSWIYPPSSVEFFTSADGVNFISQGILNPGTNGIWANERQIEKKLNTVSARFIKVIAKNYGIIPTGKAGAGNPAWLFVDEIEVE